MEIGITATRKGLTVPQQTTLLEVLTRLKPATDRLSVHHGDCVGGDEQAHRCIRSHFGLNSLIHAHPCDLKAQRAYCSANITHPVKAPLDRNRDIVLAADVMIIMPSGFVEELRSGTWATYRYAKKTRIPRVIIFPDGSVQDDRLN